MKRTAVSIKNLDYTYPNSKKVLDNVNMEVFEGEKITIMGPNGAGKTTLLLHLNGTLKTSNSDNVYIFEQAISSMNIKDRIQYVGILFEDPDDQLFMPTVYDDVAFGPYNMGLDKKEVDKRVKKSMTRVGLQGFENEVPQHLSTGQKKKVALAAVISMEPKILVLDEPTANLDPKSKSEIISFIKELNEKEGITTIIATHDVNTISYLTDRVYVLNEKIVASGTPHDIFSNPELLKQFNLEAPDPLKIFRMLECFGYDSKNHPLSINEAAENLINAMQENGDVMNLQMDKDAYENIKQLVNLYTYHPF
ncbi:ABC transporter related protein [Methanohalobium evestigatum Z-7303]|uniref:ABC transporter related protein n=1 Tax=Methanohalobium evestigatum (strain ATCC BAA-1072 / DSM 3721 / NBRC 107634 / OCM 161 / Z-7303) TaxID=644295 RepID=D7EA57_METEZ|nr:ABC transporter ATP-binding protein [Methanohalobium evestigatum]ADI74728.1 ABC transporter related protein [Methanohalobium evestigatum Z-7303]